MPRPEIKPPPDVLQRIGYVGKKGSLALNRNISSLYVDILDEQNNEFGCKINPLRIPKKHDPKPYKWICVEWDVHPKNNCCWECELYCENHCFSELVSMDILRRGANPQDVSIALFFGIVLQKVRRKVISFDLSLDLLKWDGYLDNDDEYIALPWLHSYNTEAGIIHYNYVREIFQDYEHLNVVRHVFLDMIDDECGALWRDARERHGKIINALGKRQEYRNDPLYLAAKKTYDRHMQPANL